MNTEKNYHCLCGQEFTTPNKFNAHRSRCRAYMESKGVDFDAYLKNIHEKKSISAKRNGLIKSEKAKDKKELKLAIELKEWSKEEHFCEKCNKLMLEKYASGRFCSRKCANSKLKSEESKNKVSNSLKDYAAKNGDLIKIRAHSKSERRKATNLDKYYLNPSYCEVCGKVLPYEDKRRKTCSDECYALIIGGFRVGSAKNYKYGTYKNISCDSSYELAFLVYCIDNGINIERNYDSFIYYIDMKPHKYTPDFKINSTYIELKNYMTESVRLKSKCIPPDLNYKLLFGKDIQICIDYCINTYGKNFWEVLYDPDKPSCNDKIKKSDG